jgi:mRNA interferase MazF
MKKGEIVLIPFPFTDLTGSKLRPALVLVADNNDVTVSFITTQIRWQESTDVVIKPSPNNGLKKESLLRLSKLATIDASLIIGILGTLDANTIQTINQNLIKILKLDIV